MLCCRAAMTLLTRQLVDLSTDYRTKELSSYGVKELSQMLWGRVVTTLLTCWLVNLPSG